MKVTVKIDKAELNALFSRADYIKRQERPAKAFVDWLTEETRSQFETETDPTGKRWKELKPSTLARKQGDTIGTDTGTMSRSLYGRLTKAGRGEIGFKVPYAEHFRKDRELLGMSPEREQKGQEIFEEFYQKQLNK